MEYGHLFYKLTFVMLRTNWFISSALKQTQIGIGNKGTALTETGEHTLGHAQEDLDGRKRQNDTQNWVFYLRLMGNSALFFNVMLKSQHQIQ